MAIEKKQLNFKWDSNTFSLVGPQIAPTENIFELSQPTQIQKIMASNDTPNKARCPLPGDQFSSVVSTECDRDCLAFIGMLLQLAQGSRPNLS